MKKYSAQNSFVRTLAKSQKKKQKKKTTTTKDQLAGHASGDCV